MEKQVPHKRIHWLWLVLLLLGFIIISLGLGYLFGKLLERLHLPLFHFAWKAYLIIFGISVITNLSILPLPFAVSIMIAAASKWDPVLIAFFGSLGATLGEFSSYYVGYLGKKIAIHDGVAGYETVHRWVSKYGVWAIAFLSFQPIIPFEIGGFVAGVARMPIKLFLPALWLGKFPKYIILIYVGAELLHRIPFLSH